MFVYQNPGNVDFFNVKEFMGDARVTFGDEFLEKKLLPNLGKNIEILNTIISLEVFQKQL